MAIVTGSNLLQNVLDDSGTALLPSQQSDLSTAMQGLPDSGQGTSFVLSDAIGINQKI